MYFDIKRLIKILLNQIQIFNVETQKLVMCTKLVNPITDIEQQFSLIKNYYLGKSYLRG